MRHYNWQKENLYVIWVTMIHGFLITYNTWSKLYPKQILYIAAIWLLWISNKWWPFRDHWRNLRLAIVCWKSHINFSPTIAGHRIDTYHRLLEGWSPGPEDVWSDLNMWRKFLKLDNITFHSIPAVTALILPSPFRTNMTLQEREAETAFWAKQIRCQSFRSTIQDTFFTL